MATRTISYHTLVCDGCEARFGTEEYFASVIEVRAAAYGVGWRFPERERANGAQSKSVSDVCPTCLPGWERQPARNTWKNRKGAS